ncbi:PAP2 family protein [Arthrobacter stackebrandtii]|nr:PAP2 family protein [Arthrobacter stackebrandtii]
MAHLPQMGSWVLWPAVMAVFVLALGFSAKFIPGYTPAELVVDQNISAHHDGFLNTVALALNTVFGPLGGVILVAVVCLFLLLVRRAPVNAIAFGAVAAVGWLSCQIFKVIVGRHRPDPALLANPLAPESASDSFPSGHVCLAVALAFALYYLAWGTGREKLAVVFGIFMVVVVGLSRLYIGVHYPTDVLASVIAASAAVLFFTGVWNRYAMAILARVRILQRFGPVPAPR